MPGRADRRPARFAVLLLLLVGLLAGAARAQTPAEVDAGRVAQWNGLSERADEIIQDAESASDELEDLRQRLVAQRSETLAAEQKGQPPVAELQQRLEAIGPPPAEGSEEAPEIAALRRQLQAELADAQAPVLAAQESYRRTDAQIAAIDRTLRARFSAELRSRAPSPLLPQAWSHAISELSNRGSAYGNALGKDLGDDATRQQALRRVPINLFLLVAGVAVAVWVRRMLIEWVERRLAVAHSRRAVAWLVALRNLTRLVVPAVGAGLLFAAFDPAGLLARADEGRFFLLPSFALVLIGAGWLSGSLLAPNHRAFRLVPLEDDEARRGVKAIMLLGVVVSLSYLVSGFSLRWDLSTTTQSVLQFPLVVIGAAGLWWIAGLIEVARRRAMSQLGEGSDNNTASIALRFLGGLVRVIRIIAVAAPLLGAAGYLPAAAFLVFRGAMTLGLLGGAHIVFDLLNKAAQGILTSPTSTQDRDDGLVPVVVGAVVFLAGVPLLAVLWGARWSDVTDVWTMMREGVTLGGIRLSATAVVTLIVVFAIGFGLTRLLQTVLRGTVLPRTRLDAGGRNAVLAGVGYVGFAAAGLAAVAAAGLNLSSLAIVAGALSVGIGFGLQNIVSNFVSGIILLVERPVKEGDWIEVSGFSGYVRGINVRSTEIETFDRASVILPNSDLIAGTVLNRTHKGNSGRLQVPVSVTYGTNPKTVEELLLSIAEEHPLVLQDPSPRVLFMQLGPDSMDFELRCWLRDVNFSLSVRSDMNYEIVERFEKAGIRAQYYGRDLPPVPTADPPSAPPEPEAVALLRGKQERGAI